MNKHLSNHTRKTQSINLSVFKGKLCSSLGRLASIDIDGSFSTSSAILGSFAAWMNITEFDDEDEERHGENWRIFFGRIIISKKDHIDTLKISKDFHLGIQFGISQWVWISRWGFESWQTSLFGALRSRKLAELLTDYATEQRRLLIRGIRQGGDDTTQWVKFEAKCGRMK